MIQDFETWQKRECYRLGISIDDHNKILEVSKNIEAAGLGWPYDFITSIIWSPTKLSEFAEAAEQIIVAERLSPQKSKPPRKQKYISKKARRVHGVG